jgi:hypothetical protein
VLGAVFHRDELFVGLKVKKEVGAFRKVRDGETPSPAPGTGALPSIALTSF